MVIQVNFLDDCKHLRFMRFNVNEDTNLNLNLGVYNFILSIIKISVKGFELIDSSRVDGLTEEEIYFYNKIDLSSIDFMYDNIHRLPVSRTLYIKSIDTNTGSKSGSIEDERCYYVDMNNDKLYSFGSKVISSSMIVEPILEFNVDPQLTYKLNFIPFSEKQILNHKFFFDSDFVGTDFTRDDVNFKLRGISGGEKNIKFYRAFIDDGEWAYSGITGFVDHLDEDFSFYTPQFQVDSNKIFFQLSFKLSDYQNPSFVIPYYIQLIHI